MALSPQQIEDAANDLFQAEQSGQQIGLISKRFPGISLQDAYDIQAGLVQAKLAAGRRQTGWEPRDPGAGRGRRRRSRRRGSASPSRCHRVR